MVRIRNFPDKDAKEPACSASLPVMPVLPVKPVMPDRAFWANNLCAWEGLCKARPEGPLPGSGPRGRIRLPVPENRRERILRHCTRHGISPALLFQAAIAVYLFHQNPGRRFIELGCTTPGPRTRELLLRIGLHEKDTSKALYAAVKDADSLSQRHAQCAYEDMLEMVRQVKPGVTALRDVSFGHISPDMTAEHDDAPAAPGISPNETSLDFYLCDSACLDSQANPANPASPVSPANPVPATGMEIVLDYREAVFTQDTALRALRDILRIVAACLDENDEKEHAPRGPDAAGTQNGPPFTVAGAGRLLSLSAG